MPIAIDTNGPPHALSSHSRTTTDTTRVRLGPGIPPCCFLSYGTQEGSG